jgi:hypothetical protein
VTVLVDAKVVYIFDIFYKAFLRKVCSNGTISLGLTSKSISWYMCCPIRINIHEEIQKIKYQNYMHVSYHIK